jgi:predicted O-methyltransferase YrrM
MNPSPIDRHQKAFPLNQGITSEVAYRLIDAIFSYQQAHNIQGDMMEIGVLTGATSGYLSLFLAKESRLILIDPYQNLDRAGKSIAEFSGIDSTRILCFSEDSRLVYRMKSFFLDGFLPRLQVVHVDGEHSFDAVVNDIHLAESYLVNGGVVILDDIFNVASACCTHALFDTIKTMPSLHIACIGFNKAFLCNSEHLGAYRKMFLSLPGTLAQQHGLHIRACLNDWSQERGYISIHEINENEPRYQAINRLVDDFDSLYK